VIEVLTDEIIRYENDAMSHEEEVAFFQKLIDTGLAWKLQGHYGRTAQRLIEEGACAKAGQRGAGPHFDKGPISEA
jgi:hypothetical protein